MIVAKRAPASAIVDGDRVSSFDEVPRHAERILQSPINAMFMELWMRAGKWGIQRVGRRHFERALVGKLCPNGLRDQSIAHTLQTVENT
jgi:hypothetical protein